MKKSLIIFSILLSAVGSNAFAKTEGTYAGLDIVQTNLSYREKWSMSGPYTLNGEKSGQMAPAQKGTGYGLGIKAKYAFNFDGLFIAPGLILEFNNTEAGSSSSNLNIRNRYGAKVDFGYDINDKVAPYLTVGYAQVSYRAQNSIQKDYRTAIKTGSDGNVFYGLGLKFDTGANTSVNVEYNHQTFTAKTNTNDAYVGGNAGYKGKYKANIDVVKLGLAYNF